MEKLSFLMQPRAKRNILLTRGHIRNCSAETKAAAAAKAYTQCMCTIACRSERLQNVEIIKSQSYSALLKKMWSKVKQIMRVLKVRTDEELYAAIAQALSMVAPGDAPCGRELLSALEEPSSTCFLFMDRAYEGNETQRVSRALGYEPVVPPNPNRLKPWKYDEEFYKLRNKVERLFRRIKRFRRVFTRYDKLDCLFRGFLVFVFIVDALRLC